MVKDEDKTCSSIKPNVIKALGMTLGEAVGVKVYVLNDQTLENIVETSIYMYGEKELGDWIENVKMKTIAKVKVRLEYSLTKEIAPYDEGSYLRDVAYSNLVLLEVLSEKNNEI